MFSYGGPVGVKTTAAAVISGERSRARRGGNSSIHIKRVCTTSVHISVSSQLFSISDCCHLTRSDSTSFVYP